MNEKAKRDYKKDYREFVDYLREFVEDNDSAALSSFRRGLGKEVGAATEMYRYIFPKIRYRSDEKPFFLLASLFGFYYKATNTEGNLGASLAPSSIEDKSKSKNIEKRFVALLNAREEVLHEHLRQIIGFLKSKEVPVNWLKLLIGIKFWSAPSRWIQKDWARSFWSGKSGEEDFFENELELNEINEGEENND